MIAAAILSLQALPPKGEPLLDELEHRAVRFFWEQSHPETGLTKDRATNFATSEDRPVASIASVGFALTAYSIGVKRGWLSRAEARSRTLLTLKTINTVLPNEHGWCYHFIDWKTGARMWNCEASTIDTSIMLAGMLVAQQFWHEKAIDTLVNAFVKRLDWEWMMTDGGKKPNERTICMGFRPEEGFLNARWQAFDECKMLYVQGYGLSDISTEGWSRITRESVNYKGLDLIRGGPLFMHQMSESFYNFKDLRDPLGYNYWVETKNATLANRQYCIDNPKGFKMYGPGFWGLSACDYPDGYNAFGAPGWINDDGTITPTSAVASMPFTPKESLEAAERLAVDCPKSVGRYGFSNGINPTRSWTGPDVIGIDLGMMMCGIENYRTGFVNQMSHSHPAIKRGFDRVGFKSSKGDAGKLLDKPGS